MNSRRGEVWDLYDFEGHPLGQTHPADMPMPEGCCHLVTSFWVVNPRGELLIQRRSELKQRAPGLWSVTSGCVQAGEDSLQGCIREVREELGLEIDPGTLERIFRLRGGRALFDDYGTAQDLDLSQIVLQTEEVSEVKFASPTEITALLEAGQFMYMREEIQRVFDWAERMLRG